MSDSGRVGGETVHGSFGPVKREEPVGRGQGAGAEDHNRLLPLLAAERALRAVLLIGVGVVLATHTHADWAEIARQFAQRAGLDPSRNETGRLVSSLGRFGPGQAARDAGIATGYGALEAVEAYGLLRKRRWGEYLTVVSTALLLVPEVHELLSRPTALKIGGLVLNVVIVGYLVIRLVRHRQPRPAAV